MIYCDKMRFVLFPLLVIAATTISSTNCAKNLAKYLRTEIEGEVHQKGTIGYEKRRLIHNGLCDHLYPDIIVGNYYKP